MQNLLDLTEKQLRNMDTKRINEIRKVLLKSIAVKETQDLDEGDILFLRKTKKRYDLVKEILSDREHLENPRIKTPRRENKRERNFDQ